MAIRKVLVTGSSGTIGTRLCERLMAEAGLAVTGVDRLSNAWSAAVQAVTETADLLHPAALARLPADFDLVIHLAANARMYEAVLDPARARENLLTVHNVLEFCRTRGIPRVMFASSQEVYGNAEGAPHGEESLRIRHCASPYAASKVAGEALVHAYGQCYGMDFVCFRFSNVYGMYDDSDRVVPLFIRLTKANRDLTVHGEDKLLDFTYIDDAVHGVMQAIARFDEARNEVYNLAAGEGTRIVDLAEAVRRRLGASNRIAVGPVRKGEVVHSVADIARARERLCYEPRVPFHEGIARTVQWYEEHLYR